MIFQTFLGVTAEYDGNRFLTLQDGVWKVSQQGVILAVEIYLCPGMSPLKYSCIYRFIPLNFR